ncbi:MAG: hypothetical protein NVS4B3_16170 [Gemmatimonadaceae bacterium]
MERKDGINEPNKSTGSQSGSGFGGTPGGSTGSAGYGATSGAKGSTGASKGATGGSQGSSGGSHGSTGGYGGAGGGSDAAGGQEGIADRAREAISTAGDTFQGGVSTAREKAGNIKSTLADKLEAGANRLRGQSGQLAGAAGASVASDDRMQQLSGSLATGLQSSADWLRDADMDGLKSGVETQVKEHPGRTLLIALGIGYVLGKAFRK